MLPILHRDERTVAILKPSGMLVHRGRDEVPDSAVALQSLRDQLGCRVFPVHRLDRPTSGVLLFALDEQARAAFTPLFERHLITKSYLALALGRFPASVDCSLPLHRDYLDESSSLLPCRTAFSCLQHLSLPPLELSALAITLHSGRFHQIRRHLALLQHPILGDYLHGSIPHNDAFLQLGQPPRLMLHAASLAYTCPFSGRPVSIHAAPPQSFLPFLP